MVRRTFPGAGVVLTLAVLAACAGDRPAVTAPGMEESSARERPVEPVPELPVVSVVEGYLDLPVSERLRTIAVPFPGAAQIGVCHTQIAKVQRPVPFLLERMDVEFPAEAWDEAGGESTYFVYRWRSSTGRLLEAARCRIPRSGLALEHITAQLRDEGLAWRQERRRSAQVVRVTGVGEGWTLVLGADSAPVAGTLFGAPVAMTDGGEDPCVLDPSPENPCELDGVEPTVCQNPDMEYDPELDECFCEEDKLKDPDLNECYCENGSEEEDCWLDPGDINDPPGDPPGGGGDGGDPPDPNPPSDSVAVTLTCSPGLVIRGDEVECTAVITPANDSAEFSWRFVPDSVTVFPGDTDKRQMAIDVTRYGGTTPENGHIWEGPLVLPGRVIATATHEAWSNNYADTVEVGVLDRQDWFTAVEFHGEYVDEQLSTRNHPDSATFDLGLNVDSSGVPGVGFYVGPAPVQIQSGPNRDYVYFESTASNPGYVIRRRYWINDHIKENGPRYVVMANGDTIRQWEAVPLLDSTAAHPNTLLQGMIAHETYGSGGGVGHQTAFELPELVQAPVCGNVNFLLERIAGSVGAVQWTAGDALAHAEEYLRVETGHWLVHGNFTNAPLAVNTPQGPQIALQSDSPGTKDEHDVFCPAPPTE